MGHSGAFWQPWASFWQSRGLVLRPLGSIWATQGPPGDPVGDKTEKGCEKVVRGPSPGPPPGTHFETFSGKSCKRAMSGPFLLRVRPQLFFCSVLKRTWSTWTSKNSKYSWEWHRNEEFQESGKILFLRSPGVHFGKVLEVFLGILVPKWGSGRFLEVREWE